MEKPILTVIEQFLSAERYIAAKKEGCDISINLIVGFTTRYAINPTPKITLQAMFWDGASHQTVHSASLDELTTECLRRLDYTDRTESEIDRLENSFVALPKPEDS